MPPPHAVTTTWKVVPLLLVVAVALAPSACIEHLDEEQSSIGRVERDCVVPPPPRVTSLGAPVSLEYPDTSLWIWESIAMEGGRLVENASAVVTSADAVCSAGPALATDSLGEPVSILVLTQEERTENEARADGRRLVLVPRGGFVHEGTGYLFYDHALRGPGPFDEESLGSGLCVLPPGAGQCERVGLPTSTRLFDPARRVLRILTEEATLGLGVRLAIGTSAASDLR